MRTREDFEEFLESKLLPLLRAEQAKVAAFAIVPDLDMAGARGSGLAALRAIRP